MKSNLTLIGRPGAGKSTIGIMLAKLLSFGFIDTDVLIQNNQHQFLQAIIDSSDYLNLRRLEEQEILRLDVVRHVIATGGSAVYSVKAMHQLRELSQIIFLYVDYDEIERRIHNFDLRGIAKAKSQTFMELYDERQIFYRKYSEITIDGHDCSQEEIAERIGVRVRAAYGK